MTDQYNRPINTRALTPSLAQDSPNTNDPPGPSTTMPTRPSGRQPPTTYPLPKTSNSPTTTSTSSTSRSSLITPAAPHTQTNSASAEIGAGEFSKPRINQRSRRDPYGSAKSRAHESNDEFRYYGRHANQWLFNDFSVTQSIKKGWGRIFDKGEEEDWFEKRN